MGQPPRPRDPGPREGGTACADLVIRDRKQFEAVRKVLPATGKNERVSRTRLTRSDRIRTGSGQEMR